MKTPLVLAVLATALLTSAALAADAPPQTASPAQQPMMDRIAQAMTPGPRHALLTRMAGEWDRIVRLQMDPSKPAQESRGTSTITTLMDGRYIQEAVTGEWGGMPYHGLGLYGFDNVSGQYVATLIDDMGTGFMTCVGRADSSGNVIRWDATMNDPASGKPVTSRMVTTVTDNDHHTFKMYLGSASSGRDVAIMTIECTRKR